MEKRTEETFTVQVTVENVRTGAAQTTKFCGGTDGMLEVTETKVNGGCTSAMKILREVLGEHEDQTTIKARSLGARDKFGVWYVVAKKIAEETMCRDEDGNYHLIKSERAGADEIGRAIEQKRSRELMSEDDARYWALENLRMEEYEKAFPNE